MGKVVSSILFLGAISGILAYIGAPSPLDWFIVSGNTDDSVTVASPTATPTSILSLAPTPIYPSQDIPTSLDDLRFMLATAKSLYGTTPKAEALREVAKYAVVMGYYGIAIEAGREIYGSPAEAEVLRDVSICAAEAKRYEEAVRAASEIYLTSVRDSTMKAIVEMRGRQEQGGVADLSDVHLSSDVPLDDVKKMSCPWESMPTPRPASR